MFSNLSPAQKRFRQVPFRLGEQFFWIGVEGRPNRKTLLCIKFIRRSVSQCGWDLKALLQSRGDKICLYEKTSQYE